MKYNYSFSQRLLAHLLLWTFLLQSCYNPTVPLPHLSKNESQALIKESPRTLKVHIDSQEEALLVNQFYKEQGIDLDQAPIHSNQIPSQIASHHLPANPHSLAQPLTLQPIHEKQSSLQESTNQKIHIPPKGMSVSLPHQKTTSSSRLANCPPSNIQLERFSSPTEKQIKNLFNLPVNQEKATQLSSPEALQTTHYYESQGGYQVKFIQQKQGWMACVQEVFPGFHGSFSLPVYCIGMTIQDLMKLLLEKVKGGEE